MQMKEDKLTIPQIEMNDHRPSDSASLRRKSRKRRLSRPRMVSILVVLAHVVLPLASPFVPTSAGTIVSNLASPKSMSASIGVSESQPSGGILNFLSHFIPSPGRKNERWKLGEYNATMASRLLFSYASPLLDLASERQLEESDAFPVPQQRKMGSAVPQLASIYEKCHSKARKKIEESKVKGNEVASESTVLAKALLLQQRRTLILTGILRFVNTAIQAFPALLVARLLRLVESGNKEPLSKALTAVISLVAVLSVKMLIENQYFHLVVKYATQVRGSLAGLIFDKSLRLPSGGGTSVSETDGKEKAALGAGGVLNLMQSDASILESTALQLHTIWDGPLQIAMYTTLLFRYLGRSVLWGIGVLLLTIPLNSITLRILNKMSKFENEAKDARTRRTSEAISNMKLLKLQGWEETFADDIRKYRHEELRRHQARGIIRAVNQAISNAVPALVLVVTLAAYARTGEPIVASTIFTAISLFNQLRFPLFFYPMLIDALANGRNALKRVSTYLAAEEIIPYVETLPVLSGGGGSIEMLHGNFLWSNSNKGDEEHKLDTPALCGVNLKIKPGEVVAVVGPVGSGKSALIKSLLGELSPVPRAIVDGSLERQINGTDMPTSFLEKPTVVAHGNISYASQEAWLPKGTLRDAIVFGREYNEQRYQTAIRDAGLDEDIVDAVIGSESKAAASRGVLSHSTDVGEGGSSLSGGQRARVALARALYADETSTVFLLDDPLAALDASVGSTVFERMTRRLRASKAATLLVTNDPSIPRRCDRVILMGKYPSSSHSCSTIIDIGTYDELIRRGHDLQNLSTHADDCDELDEETEIVVSSIESKTKDGEENVRVMGSSEKLSNGTDHSQHADPDCVDCTKEYPNYMADQVVPVTPDILEDNGVIIQTTVQTLQTPGVDVDNRSSIGSDNSLIKKLASTDDAMSTGAVPRSTYTSYLKSVRNPVLIVAMVLAYFMANGAQFYQQYIVAKWTEIGTGNSMAAALQGRYLQSLVNGAAVVSVFLWLRSFLTMKVGVNASEFLHNRMLKSVFGAPMSFFDATPSGQLLSRFGKEMETVDRALPDGIGSVLFCFLQIFLSASALAGVITPGMLVPIGLIGILYVKTMSKFRPAARDLKRSESKSRSPIYTHFGEALRGSEVIRSIPLARRTWSSQHQELADQNLSVFYSVKALDRWLSIRLENLGNAIVFIAAVVSVFLTRSGKLKAGSAGWGLTQALAITGLLTWAVRTLTDLETHMMSVMRVEELTDLESDEVKGPLLDSEGIHRDHREVMPKELSGAGDALVELYAQDANHPPEITMASVSDASLVQSGWPWKGDVLFKEVSMRYNPISPLVLKNITISVPRGSSLGVVGRTGSGKSSLLLTLFRLVEIEYGGCIEIDGVDIRSISLKTLRESLSIIPQDPVLFAGTLMYNLDATGNAKPEDAWAALEAASPELALQFRKTVTGLDSYISEGGKNLSAGQRQLICLARALLRRSKILVMDEATSSVDGNTDAQVQETIRREFVDKGVTVLTVAHRLDTVLGYDKIAVLGDGKLLEYGSPSELLAIRNGELRRLVEADRRNKRKGGSAKATQPAVVV